MMYKKKQKKRKQKQKNQRNKQCIGYNFFLSINTKKKCIKK